MNLTRQQLLMVKLVVAELRHKPPLIGGRLHHFVQPTQVEREGRVVRCYS